MLLTPYISSHPQKKITLAEATWEEFRPFLSKYQWALDEPGHSPRKAEIASAILNQGRKGCCTFWRDGYKYVLPVLHPRHFQQAIASRRKLYYVSCGSLVLLYFDIDLHYEWQTVAEGEEARRLVEAALTRFFGQSVIFWSPSRRGVNGYLKVNRRFADPHEANRIFDRLERALQLLLAYCENLADFEIKGRLGFMEEGEYVWAQYGKLPIHTDWSFARLEEFKGKPTVSIHGLAGLCEKIEAQVPCAVLERHEVRKKNKGDEPIRKGGCFLVTPAMRQALVEAHGDNWRWLFPQSDGDEEETWLPLWHYRPGQLPLTEQEWQAAQAQAASRQSVQESEPPEEAAVKGDSPHDVRPPVKAPTPPLKVNVKLVDLASEPDSFKRQKEALFRLARYVRRVPTPDEALKYLHEHNLFTGPWEENQGRRRSRVKDILKFIERTFDPGKCANGSVNVGKYDAWAAKKFPGGLTGRTRSGLDENGNKVEGQPIHVSPGFIAAFLAVTEFALLIDKNQDESLPHHRAESLWEALYAKGLFSVSFCARKWAVCREAMVRHGVVAITDRDYHHGKAMKWAVGPYFPFLGLWKTPKQPSLLGPGCFTKRLREKQQRHNTLLLKQSPGTGVQAPLTPARPPP
jgi:hypothetical protein